MVDEARWALITAIELLPGEPAVRQRFRALFEAADREREAQWRRVVDDLRGEQRFLTRENDRLEDLCMAAARRHGRLRGAAAMAIEELGKTTASNRALHDLLPGVAALRQCLEEKE